jgi:hypothetical protein
MIRTRDALLLAGTKLKARRVRLVVLLVTMSVLFAGLMFLAAVSTGTIRSLTDFGKEGLGKRYLVQATPKTFQPYDNQDLVNQVKPAQEKLVADKTALAKRLDITYDAKTDQDLYYNMTQNGPSPTDLAPVLTSSKLATDALNQQNSAIPGITYADFSKLAQKHGAIKTYRSNNPGSMYGPPTGNQAATIKVLLGGKERLVTEQKQGALTGIDTITMGWNQMSPQLLEPFLLKGQTAQIGADGSVPVVAPYSAAEQILGLQKLPATATTQQQLDRLVKVRQDIAGKTAQLCYRNAASAALVQQALQQKAEVTTNKGKADYTAPHLMYDVPTEPCAAVQKKYDIRTGDEVTTDAKQDQFKDAFGLLQAPDQGILTIRLVGILPDMDAGQTSMSAGGLLRGVVGSSIGSGWYSPDSAIAPGSLAAAAMDGSLADKAISQQAYYAEFKTLADAKSFIKTTNCNFTPKYDQSFGPNTEVKACVKAGTPFGITPYGNNAGAIADIQHSIWRVLRYILLAVIVIASLVMMGTFGKVIADSRRETAVFRALGATRFAISQVYLTYTVLVCALVGVVSFILGTLAAAILNAHFSPGLSVGAVLTYNAQDVHKTFSIFGLNPLYIAAILGMILLAGLLSAAVPLLLNMRRNPIRDMRDE